MNDAVYQHLTNIENWIDTHDCSMSPDDGCSACEQCADDLCHFMEYKDGEVALKAYQIFSQTWNMACPHHPDWLENVDTESNTMICKVCGKDPKAR